uniref:Uncharacterized protein n=1 Tax=Anguilla anguilla TaxID=7936 RepID=A0A0E9PEB4_ANGAN
MCVYKNKSAQ